MRKFKDIIESPFPVSTNSLWIKDNIIKRHINGKWVPIGNSEGFITLEDIKSNLNLSKVSFSGDYNDLKNTPNVVTPSANGLMSISLLQKLNGIEANANKYELPEATTDSLGGVKQIKSVDKLTEEDTTSTIISKVNEILDAMKTSKIMK